MRYTYRDLLSRLTDLRWLSLPAEAGEVSGCQSSYDRASRYDAAADRYRDWGANDDGSGCIRRLPGGGIIAFECDGPGVIWRVWSALPLSGHMRIFFDGQADPTVDMPFRDWFEVQPGDIPPLNLPELAPNLSRGRNCFIPIPFRRGCRIELDEGWGMYYHFTYTRFPDGSELPHYGERFSRDGMIALAEIDRALYDRGELQRADEQPQPFALQPGECADVWTCQGEGAIEELVFRDPGLTPEALRHLVLRIYWDGVSEPAVESPVGDFFGGAPGYARYRCLPMSMERGRFSCRFFMPFSRSARIELHNCGVDAVRGSLSVVMDDTPGVAEGRMRFHAKWHRGWLGGLDRARFSEGGDRWPDWPLLWVEGAAGRFCGAHMHIQNTWPQPEEKPEAWWYGVWSKKTVDWWWG